MFAQVKYSKYHALGNDYLVITPQDLAFELTPEKIERICHRNFGIGSDGILFGPLPSNDTKSGLTTPFIVKDNLQGGARQSRID